MKIHIRWRNHLYHKLAKLSRNIKNTRPVTSNRCTQIMVGLGTKETMQVNSSTKGVDILQYFKKVCNITNAMCPLDSMFLGMLSTMSVYVPLYAQSAG